MRCETSRRHRDRGAVTASAKGARGATGCQQTAATRRLYDGLPAEAAGTGCGLGRIPVTSRGLHGIERAARRDTFKPSTTLWPCRGRRSATCGELYRLERDLPRGRQEHGGLPAGRGGLRRRREVRRRVNDCRPNGSRRRTVQCRPAAGVCDWRELHRLERELSSDVKSTAVCRAAAGDCDVAESCDRCLQRLPGERFKAATVQCRTAAGACDLAESCNRLGARTVLRQQSTAVSVAPPRATATSRELRRRLKRLPHGRLQTPHGVRASAARATLAESCTGSSATLPCRREGARPSAGPPRTSATRPRAATVPQRLPRRRLQAGLDPVPRRRRRLRPRRSCTGSSRRLPAPTPKQRAVCRGPRVTAMSPRAATASANDCPADVKKATPSCRAARRRVRRRRELRRRARHCPPTPSSPPRRSAAPPPAPVTSPRADRI